MSEDGPMIHMQDVELTPTLCEEIRKEWSYHCRRLRERDMDRMVEWAVKYCRKQEKEHAAIIVKAVFGNSRQTRLAVEKIMEEIA